MKEVSKIEIFKDDVMVHDGFHDEFDALEWLLNNQKKGVYSIKTTRTIEI